MKKISSFFKKTFSPQEGLFFSIIAFIFFVLRLPSLIEPYWYGDEGIYQIIGIALRNGRILYQGIWDNKPPLLYLIYAVFNGDQYLVRLLSLIIGLVSIFLFFLLAKKLFKKFLSISVSTLFFAIIFGLPIIEGNIANAENFMLAPIMASFYLALLARENNKVSYYVFSGFLLSFAFLTKIVAIFDFAALSLIIFILRFTEEDILNRKKINKEIKNAIVGIEQEVILAISFAVPIFMTFAYFLGVGAFSDFWRAAMSQNVGYVGYGNYFLFPMGLLFLKLTLLIFLVLLILRYRKALGESGVLIFIWLIFSVFNALFSARPYTHYLLVLLPAFSFFLGYIIENKKALKFTIPVMLILIFLINMNFRLYTKLVPYYANYLSFLGGGSIKKYHEFFDRNTTRDYALADFIKVKTAENENVFLWGDSAQVYALSNKLPPGRYTVSYHITFYKNAVQETLKDLDRAKPKYIMQVKDSPEIGNFLEKYNLKYQIENVKIYEREI